MRPVSIFTVFDQHRDTLYMRPRSDRVDRVHVPLHGRDRVGNVDDDVVFCEVRRREHTR